MAKGKKKNKGSHPHAHSHQQDEDSGASTPSPDEDSKHGEKDQEELARCPHVGKAVHVPGIKKALKTAWAKIGQCGPCAKEARQGNTSAKTSGTPPKAAAPAQQQQPGKAKDPSQPVHVWMCLRCGLQLCGDNSSSDHFRKHCNVPRSDVHCVGLNLMTWRLQCVECDSEVAVDSYKKVREAVDFVRKMEETKGRASGTPGQAGPKISKVAGKVSTSSKADAGALSALGRPRGLSNLGNTCFFNSIMQSLSQTHPLLRISDEQSRKGTPFKVPEVIVPPSSLPPSMKDEDVTKEAMLLAREGCLIEEMNLVLSDAGPLTQALSAFLKEMSNQGKQGVVNPGNLFGKVCSRAPQFRGFHQQDAHELLRQLMEGLRAEETRRQKSSILRQFSLSEKSDPKSVPWPVRKRLQALSQYSSYTFIDRMFGGHLVSTIVCEQCHNSSQIYEPFLDLSLPLIEEKPQRPNAKKGKNATNSASKAEDDAASVGNSKKEREKNKKEKRKLKKEKKRMGKKGALKISDVDEEAKGDDVEDNKLASESQEEIKSTQDEDVDDGEEKLRKEMEENEKDRSNSPSNMSEKSQSQEKEEGSVERENAALGDDKCDNSRDSGLAMSKLSVSDSQKVAAARGPSDGNEEDDEDDGYSEDDDDGWEWDYGEGAEEEEEQKDQKDKEDESDNKSTYLDIESQVPAAKGAKNEKLESLNPLPPERLERGSSEREKSSDPTGDNDEESSGSSSDEAGTSVVGDIEDNLDDVVKTEAPQQGLAFQDRGGEQQLLTRLLSFNPDPEHLDPHMEALCRKVRKLSVASVQVQSLSESCGNNNFGPDEGTSSKKYSVANGDDDGTSLSGSSVTADSVADQQKLSLRNEWVARSLTSIAPRYHAEAGECSVYSCLTQFTAPELLTGNNKWACDKCTRIQAAKKACALAANELDSSDASAEDEPETGDDNNEESAEKVKKSKKEKSPPTVYSNASKQLLIFSPPAVLTIHLKRFQQTMFNLRKVNKHVQFPLTLDLAPFCSSTAFSVPSVAAGTKSIRYDLYAVVEHQGRLQGGHYTAYVKVRPAHVPFGASDSGSPANDYERFYSQPSAKTEEIHTLLSEIERKCREYAEGLAEAENAKEDKESENNIDQKEAETVKQSKTATPRKWFHVSDSHVSEVSEDKVLQSQAYILFYERFE